MNFKSTLHTPLMWAAVSSSIALAGCAYELPAEVSNPATLTINLPTSLGVDSALSRGALLCKSEKIDSPIFMQELVRTGRYSRVESKQVKVAPGPTNLGAFVLLASDKSLCETSGAIDLKAGRAYTVNVGYDSKRKACWIKGVDDQGETMEWLSQTTVAGCATPDKFRGLETTSTWRAL